MEKGLVVFAKIMYENETDLKAYYVEKLCKEVSRISRSLQVNWQEQEIKRLYWGLKHYGLLTITLKV